MLTTKNPLYQLGLAFLTMLWVALLWYFASHFQPGARTDPRPAASVALAIGVSSLLVAMFFVIYTRRTFRFLSPVLVCLLALIPTFGSIFVFHGVTQTTCCEIVFSYIFGFPFALFRVDAGYGPNLMRYAGLTYSELRAVIPAHGWEFSPMGALVSLSFWMGPVYAITSLIGAVWQIGQSRRLGMAADHSMRATQPALPDR